ncbi:MAG: hypothetical protein GTN70_09835 [Deltaproteobacteria bacterium]|nr:hypothetical protein [Deltaproteobacteria bacterium]NIS78077.1 hypothetical protein [Deltaproteobacteria bacterium]
MSHKDFLIGNVVHVLDGDTFELTVTRVGKKNRNIYDEEEKIHINRLKPAEIVSLVGARPKPLLERMLMKREVMCLVNSREPGGKIEADVFIM